jgi:hypothetical protein
MTSFRATCAGQLSAWSLESRQPRQPLCKALEEIYFRPMENFLICPLGQSHSWQLPLSHGPEAACCSGGMGKPKMGARLMGHFSVCTIKATPRVKMCHSAGVPLQPASQHPVPPRAPQKICGDPHLPRTITCLRTRVCTCIFLTLCSNSRLVAVQLNFLGGMQGWDLGLNSGLRCLQSRYSTA